MTKLIIVSCIACFACETTQNYDSPDPSTYDAGVGHDEFYLDVQNTRLEHVKLPEEHPNLGQTKKWPDIVEGFALED